MSIWKILGYFGTAAGTLAILYGAFQLLDDIRDDVSDTKETVEYINVEQAIMDEKLSNICDTVGEMGQRMIQMGRDHDEDMVDVINMFHKQNRNLFTPEQMELLLDEWLQKNTSSVEVDSPFPFDLPYWESTPMPLDSLENTR